MCHKCVKLCHKCVKIDNFLQKLTTFSKTAEIRPATEMIDRNRALTIFCQYGNIVSNCLKLSKMSKIDVFRVTLTLRMDGLSGQKVTNVLNV